MLTLGLNFGGHDPSAALVADGELVAMASQERFSRHKHASGESPASAVSWCLNQAGIKAKDVDEIAIGWDHSLFRSPVDGPSYSLENALPEDFLALPGPPQVQAVRHHRAHAASAFYCSPFEEAAVLVVDGQGERESTSLWAAGPDGIRLVESLPVPLSLGHFYRAAAQYAGLERNGSRGNEGKLMGLAPYGVGDQPMPLTVGANGLELAPEVALPDVASQRRILREAYVDWWKRRNFPFAVGQAAEITAYTHFAASVQRTLEQALLHLARRARSLTGSANIVLAGGVAMNCTANGVLADERIFEGHFFQPVAADDGVSLGAALEVSAARYRAEGRPVPRSEMRHAFWGPEHSDEDCARALESASLPYRRCGADDLVAQVADLLADGMVVGWFQGRAEVGPRALGARSILADPRDRSMVVRLNGIKGREVWRPLAPSVLAEAYHEFFTGDFPSPFMNVATSVRPRARAAIPAVVHIDGSARPQAVTAEDAPLYWSVIDAFRDRTGIPVLLNTSFNLAHEPIVNTPQEAIRSFLDGGMDALALGANLVARPR